MFGKIRLVLQTVIHLKPVQIYYQLYYKLRNKLISRAAYANLKGYKPVTQLPKLRTPNLVPGATGVEICETDRFKFTFINLSSKFERGQIDWNFSGHGKLWAYNLNYFDFLFLPNFEEVEKVELIEQYCTGFDTLKDGLEPYPISIRGINWVKFFSLTGKNTARFDECLFRQYKVLCANLEFHLLANHLLENAFSLLFGAYYFRNEQFYARARKLLLSQLEEQIFLDGGHFERSVMYHQIVLYRLLECYDLVASNDWKQDDLLKVLGAKAENMLNWLQQMTFSNGDIPYVKDSAPGIAPNTEAILSFALKIGLSPKRESTLMDSGYRFYKSSNLEVLADVGAVNPSYQPGHAHADALNFCLYANGHPVIVETGTSTYNINARRQLERSTEAHNCLTLVRHNSSTVWGGFRVAERAKVDVTHEKEGEVTAEHDGYKKFGLRVSRNFSMEEDKFELTDSVVGTVEGKESLKSFLHFFPGLKPEIRNGKVELENLVIHMEGYEKVKLEEYKYALGFNKLQPALRLVLTGNQTSKITVSVHS